MNIKKNELGMCGQKDAHDKVRKGGGQDVSHLPNEIYICQMKYKVHI